MSCQASQPRRSLPYRFLNGMLQSVGSAIQAGEHIIARGGAQLRGAMLHPLRPFPLAHVTGVVGASSSQLISAQDARKMREHHHPLDIAGLPQATLQNAHCFLTQLPAWLQMPETRRHGNDKVALEWSADNARKLNVMIGQDGMLIYSARLGAKGRLDGAEPIGDKLSPVVTHVIRQLRN